MSLSAGTQLGPYEVIDLLGAGAMGEVYRARDTRLRRTVALKVLPPAIGGDPARLKRFEQEARAAGALNHPNIVAIHDVGSQGGSPYVVSELLEGSTLRARMAGAPLPPRKAVEYAIQVARGLAAAHEKGVVHRDLKPDNIFVTRDGAVKILDFGLARVEKTLADVLEEEGTGSAALTEEGTLLGTVGYMAPEQVRGEKADHRSDIFAFGTVLYEMLTGRRAFRGASAVETMNAILKEEPPPPSGLQPAVPPALERILDHCLEKDPAERFQSARDLAFHLEALTTSSGSGARAALEAGDAAWRRVRPALAAAAIVALPALGFLVARATTDHAHPDYQRLTFRRGTVYSGRLAPDGHVVYGASWDGQPMELYARRAETPEARPLGIRNARVVGISPAGELAVLLLREDGPGVLARVPATGGPPREVLEHVLWADWAGGDFAVVRHHEGRYRLEYPAGTVLQTSTSGNFFSHPRLSPDGDLVAYLEHPVTGDDRGAVAVVDRAGRRTMLSSGWASIEGLAWSREGDKIYFTATSVGADAALYVVDLSGRRRLVEKAPGRLVLFDVGKDGRLLVARNSTRVEMRGVTEGRPEQDLSWFDISSPVELSADASKVLFYESGEGGGEGYSVYLRPTDGSLPVRLGSGRAAALSPDGRHVLALSLDDPPTATLFPTGAGEPRVIRHPQIEAYRWGSFTPDGRQLVFAATERGRKVRLYAHDLETGVLRAVTPEGVGGFSRTITPDGRWIVGATAGVPESWKLYPLEPLDGGPGPRPIPGLQKGDQPLRWDADGRALYVARGSRPLQLVKVDVTSGARAAVREFVPADPAGVERLGAIVLSADAKTVVYSYHRMLSDLYLVRGIDD